ncbi:hypothetical protein BJF83_04730 [Nocardiopsis sp. CNR-923]|nr:hypothetical protein BJF83_04730 [Nocardiopsis sp. CNR-923]
MVAAFTCFEQPQDSESVAMTEGWEFTSGLVGVDSATGEQVWRTEQNIGSFPDVSRQRILAARVGGIVSVSYPNGEGLLVVDANTGEETDLGAAELLWANSDGSRLGVWDALTDSYRIQDRSGEAETGPVALGEARTDSLADDGGSVGLEGGVVLAEGDVRSGDDPVRVARFEGFDESFDIEWDAGSTVQIDQAIAVPGAVVLSYTDEDGRSGVIGLR